MTAGVPVAGRGRLHSHGIPAAAIRVEVAAGVAPEAGDEEPEPAQEIRGLGGGRGGGAPGDRESEDENEEDDLTTKRSSAHGGLREERSAGVSMIPGAALRKHIANTDQRDIGHSPEQGGVWHGEER